MEGRTDNIALIDLDGTVTNHDGALLRDLKKIHGPDEPPITLEKWRNKSRAPDYMFQRIQMVRSCSGWWENLDVIPYGMELVNIMKDMGYRIVVLTQGPKANASAWKGKVNWVHKHMPNTDIVITRDKSIVYGKVLFDDYPQYLEGWLKYRPRGLAIMNAFEYNKDFKHPNVIRYRHGKNKDKVVAALKKQLEREPYESVAK